MKMALSAQQIVHFRKQGHVRFENFPLDLKKIENYALAAKSKRDFWRSEPKLKKTILHSLGPIALEITKKNCLFLACDQWMDMDMKTGRMQDIFCFQGLACLFLFSENKSSPDKGTVLDIFDPSSLASLFPNPCYLVAFALENAVLIENSKDPFNLQTRNLGYVYGDRLINEFHPQIRSN